MEPYESTFDRLLDGFDQALHERRWPEARRRIDHLRALAPFEPEVWGRLGQLQALCGQLGDAAESFSRAATLEPGSHRGPSAQARVLERLGREGEALEAWAEACERAPDFPDVWLSRGALLAQLARRFSHLVDRPDAAPLAPHGGRGHGR